MKGTKAQFVNTLPLAIQWDTDSKQGLTKGRQVKSDSVPALLLKAVSVSQQDFAVAKMFSCGSIQTL